MQSGLESYIPKQHAAEARRQLKQKWNHRCAYCNYQEKSRELTVDHVLPLSKGGSDSYFNMVPACRSCNLSKGSKPVRQWYFDHPEYSAERWNKIKNHIMKEHDVSVA